MSNFTEEQKKAFVSLAQRYDQPVFEIVNRGNNVEIYVVSEEEAKILDEFSSKICGLVVKDYPDHEGKDEDINADAEMVVHMISDILSESNFEVICSSLNSTS